MSRNSWDIPPPPGCDSDFERSQEQIHDIDRAATSSNRLFDPLVRSTDINFDRKEITERPKHRSKSRSVERSHRRRRSRSKSQSKSRYSRKKRSRSRRRRHHSSSRSRSRSGSRERRSRHKSRRHRKRSTSRSRSRSKSPGYRKRSHKRDRERRRRSYTRSPSAEKIKPPEPPKPQPEEEEVEDDEEEEEEPVKENAFKNDGSFLEMFKKMQEQQQQQAQPKPEPSSEIKKPLPFFGKRRGGKVLKTGLVQKAKTAEEEEETSLANQDAWSVYMKEVRRYKEACCDDDSKTRPLVK